MVRNLFIVRHAESSEAARGYKDIERTLTQKGYKDASRLGKYFVVNNIAPDIIITSNAERAVTTASLMVEQIKIDKSKIVENEELYETSARVFLNVVCGIDDDCKNVIIVGHNPTIVYFAEYITKTNVGDVEPAGMLHLEFDIDSWKMASEGNGKLVKQLSPADFDHDV
jgi:phosphohistidine phosphatase